MFRWYLRDWYNVGAGLSVAVLACGVLVSLSTLQKILLLSFAVLCLHEFEEYGWPGGFPSFMNRVMFPKIAHRLGRPGGPSDRYILNQANSVFVNVAAAYPFYALPIFFPHLIWLGLAPVLFSLMELVIHGGIATSAVKALYNPGLFTSLLWLILSAWYIAEAYRQHLITGADWGIAVGYVIAWTVIALPLFTFVLLSDRDSPYPFSTEELSRFEKYRRLIHTTVHP